MASAVNASPDSSSPWCPYTTATWLALGGVLILAAVPRLYELDRVNYWFDESFTLKMAEYGPLELLQRLTEDTHPPLFYFILQAWIALFAPLGVSPRGLSVVCGLATVAGVYVTVLEAFRFGKPQDVSGPRQQAQFAATLAGLLVALSPLHISWSNQVRMYSLMTALAAISSWLLFRALRPDATRRDWIAFTVITSLQMYTHYYALFLVAAEYLFALVYLWRASPPSERSSAPNETTVLLSAAGVYLLFLPWQVPFWDQRARVDESFHTRPLTWSAAGETLGQSFDLHLAVPVTGEIGLLIALVLIVVLTILFRSGYPGLIYLGAAGLTPFIAGVVVSLGMRNVFATRYVMSGQMFLLASIAAAIAMAPARRIRPLIAAAIVAGAGWLTLEQCLIRRGHAELPGMREAMRYLDSRRHPDEPVVVVNPMLFTTLVQYTRERAGVRVIGDAGSYPYYQGTAAMREDEYVSRSELEPAAAKRLWTVDADKWFGGAWVAPIPRGWKEVGRTRFRDFYAEIVIRRYEPDGL